MKISGHSQCALSWQGGMRLPLTPATLDMLFAGEVGAICIPDFLTEEECLELRKRAEECEFNDYLNVTPRIGRIGITVFEFDRVGKERYFEAVESANYSVARITNGICCPLQRALGWLSRLSPDRRVNIAYEPHLGPYFAGLFRRIEEGTLIHVDFAPIEQPGWAVAHVQSQLALNIYLDAPQVNPGVVRIWRKQWQPKDHAFKIPNSYGYMTDVVKGVSSITITPRTGMMLLINTRNFHQVAPATGGRLAISAAIGQLSDKDIVVWS